VPALNLGIMKWLPPHDMNAAPPPCVLGILSACGLVIALTGWTPADPIAALFICVLIAVSSLRLLREAMHALMEGAPLKLSSDAVGTELARQEGVLSVHDLHIWTLSGSRVALSAHVVVRDLAGWDRTLHVLQHLLHERFGIEHAAATESPRRPWPGWRYRPASQEGAVSTGANPPGRMLVV
jgi:cobalt-zinc-cadmium efflux system protein